jgi:hypothetical protein
MKEDMNNFGNIKTHIYNSQLAEWEKEEMVEVLSSSENKNLDLDDLEKLFLDHPWTIPFLFVCFSAQKYAHSAGDKDAIRRTVDLQTRVISNLDSKKASDIE